MRWRPFSGAGREEWNALIAPAEDSNPFQSYSWGEFKRSSGWEPQRWVGSDDHGRDVACAQALVKRLPLGRCLVWVPGGPVAGFDSNRPERIEEAASSWLEAFAKSEKPAYVRFRSQWPYDAAAAYALRSSWRRPLVKREPGFTLHIDLTPSIEELVAAADKKHRYSIRQAQKRPLEWKIEAAGRGGLKSDVLSLYGEMQGAKGLEKKSMGAEDLRALMESFGDELLALVGYEDGRPLSMCLTHVGGRKACYMFAASGQRGRELGAPYAMVVRLFEELKARDVPLFDFCGLAPGSSSAAGVDRFKLGFGGRVVEHLGEWEWASSPPLRWGVSAVLALNG